MIIKKTMAAIRKTKHQLYTGEGEFSHLSCSYKIPVDVSEISKFEIKYKCVVPKDYKEFLLISNGMRFEIAGELNLFCLEEVIEILKTINYKEGIYPIGFVLDDYVVIKSDEIHSGKYVYVGDCYCRDEYFSLEADFETFLDRYFIANACNYWRWGQSSEKFCFVDL